MRKFEKISLEQFKQDTGLTEKELSTSFDFSSDEKKKEAQRNALKY